MNKMYKIKVTYLEGNSEGRSFLLGRGGHVFDEDECHWSEDCYLTRAAAASVCKRYAKENKRCRDFERNDEKYLIAKGHSPKSFYIYHYQKFEPYEVEAFEID